MTNIIKNKNYFFSFSGSLLILSLTVMFGFVLELFTMGKGITPLSSPYNYIVLAELIILLPLLYHFYKKTNLIRWLTSIPVAISSISILTILVLIIGFLPQAIIERSSILTTLGFGHIFRSWPYLIASFQLLIVLGLITVKRLYPITLRNLCFFLNHAGLWLIIAAATLGVGDFIKMQMHCTIDAVNNIGYNENREAFEMPFSLKLHSFSIDEYTPTLVMIDNKTGEIIEQKKKNDFSVASNKEITIGNKKVLIKNFIPYAFKHDTSFIEKDSLGAVAAAYIVVDGKKTWIASGNYYHAPVIYSISDKLSLALTVPLPKRYHSVFTVLDTNNIDTMELAVNKPYKINGWEIYQTGFDEKKGKWSNLSIVEAVRDPWLPIVYLGIFMLLAGNLLLFWIGQRKDNHDIV